MDSLASLALATEEPHEGLLNRKPHDRNQYIISKKMFKHVMGQAIYQFCVILILVFGSIFLSFNKIKKKNIKFQISFTKKGMILMMK